MFGFRDNRVRTVNTNTTDLQWTIEFYEPVTLEQDEIRRIVRQELAELLPVDVPDAPPEDLR